MFPHTLRRPLRRILLPLALLAWAVTGFAAEPDAIKSFDLPAGPAAAALNLFATQSGFDVVFATETTGDIRTPAVKGNLAPADAMAQLLAGTGLIAQRNDRTGAFTILHDPNAGGVAPQAPSATPVSLSKSRMGDETVMLSPFEVQTDVDSGYGATNSNSLTAFNVALDHLPISADIFDQKFMNDVGSTSLENTVLNYSAGAGMSSTTAGATATSNQPGDRVFGAQVQLRGLTTPSMQRDSFLAIGSLANPGSTSIGETNNFDIERVDIINGPQALLYAAGGGGGVINAISKQARLGMPAFGSFKYRIDQYGSKMGQFDYGTSAGNVAVRFAVVNAAQDTRRVNIGEQLAGDYLQIAARVANTIIRLGLEQTTDWRVDSTYLTLTSTGDAAYSAFNGQQLNYLIATNQAGSIAGGLNWSNSNSLEGEMASDTVVTEFSTLQFESQWTPWLSTQFSLGLSNWHDDHVGDTQTLNFYSPGATANPQPGNWAVGWSGYPGSDGVRSYHGRAARFNVLSQNDLFGGKARSNTVLGADYLGTRGTILEYDYYAADSNFVPLASAATTTGGRVIIPALSWPVNHGPVLYPLFRPISSRINYNNQNYVRLLENPLAKEAVSPANPYGTTIPNGNTSNLNVVMTEGVYGMNHTQWLDGRLDSFVGARIERIDSYHLNQLTSPPTNNYWHVNSNSFNFNAGLDYHVLPWLVPYVSASDSHFVAPVLAVDPVGNQLLPSHSLGEEAGVKVHTASGALSGSLALYHVSASNQQSIMVGSLVSDINPTGLNGTYAPGRSGNFTSDSKSQGAQMTLTAAPAKNWRLRFSAAYTDGKSETTRTYGQLYNDQFYENSSGQITYADGTVVYVPATYNSKQLTVTSTTAGAIPLTAALISNPSSSYYANPNLLTGSIASGSAAANVLKTVDPTHGAILTGVAGLPISQIQLITSQVPGLAIPGVIRGSTAGNVTIGYPELAANVTGVYEFDRGALTGFRVGGTAAVAWENRQFYYYPTGIAAEGPYGQQNLFKLPTISRFDLILGYSHKFSRFTWDVQLNVYNLLNHYAVIVYPDPSNGYSSVTTLKANLDQQPRSFALTNTLSF